MVDLEIFMTVGFFETSCIHNTMHIHFQKTPLTQTNKNNKIPDNKNATAVSELQLKAERAKCGQTNKPTKQTYQIIQAYLARSKENVSKNLRTTANVRTNLISPKTRVHA